jgi:hypothetical protein
MQRWSLIGLVVVSMLVASCGTANNPAAPAPASPAALQPLADTASAPTLKASAPSAVQPVGNLRVDTRRPTLEWQNARGRFIEAAFTYDVELYELNTLYRTFTVAQASGANTSVTVPDDLQYDTMYRWRVRARFGNAVTAWTTTANFYTPMPPFVPGQPYGPIRSISEHEALSIIRNYHDLTGANLGSGSTRDSRVAFLWAAMAVIHYGHPTYNASGGDRDWCVKDAGFGRPPSDDVIVRCSTRDAWDLVGGAGADGYSFHLDYIGKLPSEQNVYPPPLSSLPK